MIVETHRYIETTADQRQVIEWRLEKKQNYILTSTMPNEISVCTLDQHFDTHLWQIQRTDTDTRVTARRGEEGIYLSGILDGAKIKRTLKIDTDPWYQAGSISLRAFARSTEAETRFWILRPGKFTLHKLQATRQGLEAVKVAGRTVKAHKIKVCLTGWKAPFWSATYWFRAQDGVFLRYQGASGPPGSKETIVEWVPADVPLSSQLTSER